MYTSVPLFDSIYVGLESIQLHIVQDIDRQE